MKYILRNLPGVLLLTTLLMATNPVTAQTITQLTIAGDDSLPGISGNYSTSSTFSWMSQIFPTNPSGFSWTLGPGTDGGLIFNQAQNYGEMVGIRAMFNQPTTFYSVGAGITLDLADTIDMANLRMSQAGIIIDVGSGSGFNTLISRVADINNLAQGENGWALNQDGSYNLIYNTIGTCATCALTLHFYGVTVVPLPATAWLLFSGLSGLIGFSHYRKIKKY